jgi:hypothetical protein
MSAGCDDCPSEVHVELAADTLVAIGQLETEVRVDASSYAWPPEGADSCKHGDVRIERFRWDLDGDGTFELSSRRGQAQRVQLTAVGMHRISIEVVDEQGNAASDDIVLTVIDSAPRSALGTVLTELVPSTMAPECIAHFCLRASTSLAQLHLDQIRVVNPVTKAVVLETGAADLTSESRELACASLSPDDDWSEEPVVTYFLADAQWSRDAGWDGREICTALSDGRGNDLPAREDSFLDHRVDAPVAVHHLRDAEVDTHGHQ